jgi:hypothetical protein
LILFAVITEHVSLCLIEANNDAVQQSPAKIETHSVAGVKLRPPVIIDGLHMLVGHTWNFR